jgi:hypothetical protein
MGRVTLTNITYTSTSFARIDIVTGYSKLSERRAHMRFTCSNMRLTCSNMRFTCSNMRFTCSNMRAARRTNWSNPCLNPTF